MRERPILFSAPMVRALLAGNKTQTRRVVKRMALDWLDSAKFSPDYVADPGNDLCPYGKVADRLWVKETFFSNDFRYPAIPDAERPGELYYRADGLPDFEGEESQIRWRPSIFMPRWASRILLEITATRVQRLQDISAEDAIAEGLRWREAIEAWTAGDDNWPTFTDPRRAYAGLWDHINGAGAWDANPWVWVLSFNVSRPAHLGSVPA